MAPLPTLSPRRGTGKVNRAGRGIKGEGSYNFHEVRRSEPTDSSVGQPTNQNPPSPVRDDRKSDLAEGVSFAPAGLAPLCDLNPRLKPWAQTS